MTTETLASIALPPADADPAADPLSDRRDDIEAKTARVTGLLQETGCEGLLLLAPENVAWITSGGVSRGTPDPSQAPAVYSNGDQRWLLCANADTQRFFDEEIDGLGFQLKEWPWHWGRDQLLTDLGVGRKVACDADRPGTTPAAEPLRRLRRVLTPYEQASLRMLGALVAHALEATCRTIEPPLTEREVAGQLAHRLIHRGAHPVHIGVAADERGRLYRQFGYTSAVVQKYAVLTATARKYGLHATASRSVSFGPVPDDVKAEHNACCRVSASYLASSWPDAVPREVLQAGRRIYLVSGFEHEWLEAPAGHLTGRLPVEAAFTPATAELLQAGAAVVWQATAGAAVSCDTFLVTDAGPITLTPHEVWPLKRIRIQGAEFIRPDVLVR